MVTLTAIVPATDRPPSLGAAVDAIRAADEGPEELIVVTEPSHEGPAAARNLGAGEAKGGVLVFVDSDVVVHSDAFVRIRAAFGEDPGLGALFGSYDDRVGGSGPVSAFRNMLHRDVHVASAGDAQTFWAGLGAVRRDVLLRAGGFDADRYPRPSIEDIELGLRLNDGGARIVLDPQIQGTHLKRWSVASMVRTDLFARGVPWVVLMAERGSAPKVMNLTWRHRLSAAASGAFVLAGSRRRPREAAFAAAALLVLNRAFYGRLWRAGGSSVGSLGPALHLLHHLAAAAAVPLGLAVHLRGKLAR